MRYVLFACGVGLFLFACAQLLTKNKQPVHYFMIFGCFAADYTILYFWAYLSGYLLHVPALALSSISSAAVTAPAFYLAALFILYEGKPPVQNYKAYFIAPVIFSVVFSIHNAVTAPAYFEQFGTVPGHFETPFLWFITSVVLLSMPAVIIADLLAALKLHRTATAPHTRTFRSQVVFLFCYLGASSLFIAACITGNELLIAAGTMAFGLIALGFSLTFTAVFLLAKDRSPRTTPARPEWDSTEKELSTRLNELMERYAPYKEPELTVAELAEMLKEEPKRLSYHFNMSLGTNFRHYINELRLESVCLDLVESPDRTILDIAFANGFNSKSSFNTLFMKSYGMTPRQFRKQHMGKSSDGFQYDSFPYH